MLLGSIFKGQNLSSRFLCAKIVGSRCAGRSNYISSSVGSVPRLFEIDVVIVSLKGCVHGGPLWICILESVVLFC
jgi:hypothetical protein